MKMLFFASLLLLTNKNAKVYYVVSRIYFFTIGGITMAYKISDACVMCGSCAGACPMEAISEGDGQYVIDADKCVDCGTCEAACPMGAISQG